MHSRLLSELGMAGSVSAEARAATAAARTAVKRRVALSAMAEPAWTIRQVGPSWRECACPRPCEMA